MYKSISTQDETYLLTCDHRVGQPDVLNDQVWETRIGTLVSNPISLFSTLGLRSSSILLFPVIKNNEDPLPTSLTLINKPGVNFRSTNSIEIKYAPFKDIDVILRLWVPASQVLVGQVTLKNTSGITQPVEMDWISRLDFSPPGKPMVLEQLGINKVLLGQTGGLFPLFYISGGPEESPSTEPGLRIRSILPTHGERQVTWVMAALENAEASLQTARQYSSISLELEQLKYEMTDRRKFIHVNDSKEKKSYTFLDTQIQAQQLIMPGVNSFQKPTYLQERTPLTPSIPDIRYPQLNPAWSGQTLPELYLLSQVVLPGYPTLMVNLLTNELKAQSEDGGIDACVNAGNQPTGLLAPPLLCSIVQDLIPYLHDFQWLRSIYPNLEGFMHRWFAATELPALVHPLQTGLDERGSVSNPGLESLWLRLATSFNPFLHTLLVKEGNALVNIAHKIGVDPSEWLKTAVGRAWMTLQSLWDDDRSTFSYRDLLSGKTEPGQILHEFSEEGKFTLNSRIKSPKALYVKIYNVVNLPPSLKLVLTGRAYGKSHKVILQRENFDPLGDSNLSIILEPFSTLSSMQISGLPGKFSCQIGTPDHSRVDITSFIPMCIREAVPEKLREKISEGEFARFMDESGLWLEPNPRSPGNFRVPDFLASLIIEGILDSGYPALALEAYRNHFLSEYAAQKRSRQNGRIESLVPLRLYLSLLGIKEIFENELVLQSFNTLSEPVTVQYGQITITVNPDSLSLTIPGEDPLVISTPEPQRVHLGRERRLKP